MASLATQLSKVLEAKVTVEKIEGGTRLDIAWPKNGSARIDLYEDRAYWQGLFVRGLGIHPKVGHTVAKFLKDRGFRCMEMSDAADKAAREVILAGGPWEPAEVEYRPGHFTSGFRWSF